MPSASKSRGFNHFLDTKGTAIVASLFPGTFTFRSMVIRNWRNIFIITLEILISRKEKVCIMDEINRSLHPKLTVQFVKKYFSNARERKIQLVTTTHESRIMSHDLVRRDEIWIADKNEDDSTKLFSLEDEQVRIDKVLDQNYMDNVWGGVPVFADN